MSEIFISYARSTEAQAERIASSLEALGYGTWRDDQLPSHRPYTNVLDEHLRAAKAVVVIWSEDAAASDWVRAEANVARGEGKLVQVVIDGATLPLPFKQFQCVDLSQWQGQPNEAQWRKVVSNISRLIGPGVIEAPDQNSAVEPLLAVLPFDNLSGDSDLLYFSDGVTEEILQTVAQATGLRVIGRSSSFQFRGGDKSARKVARELQATHVLDGSVRRGGDRVRISASLMECASQTVLWSDRFDRDLSDVFALQDEIAAAVAAALKMAFAPSTVRRVDPAAYDLYLRARSSTPGRNGAFDADQLRLATQKDAAFAQAWSALAITRALQASTGSGTRLDQARTEALACAEKALSLDRTMGAPYVALALLEPICGRFAEVERLFEQALAAAPDDVLVLEKYSRWLFGVGRGGDAFAHVARAHELEPLYHQGANWYAVMLANRGRRAEAFEVWERGWARWPDFDIFTVNPLVTAANTGDWDRVDSLTARARDADLDSQILRDAFARAEELRRAAPRSTKEWCDVVRTQLQETKTLSLNTLSSAYRGGLRDELFAMIDQASFAHLFRPGGRLLPQDYGLHTLFGAGDRMMHDVRFVGLCAKLGLCDYWRTTDRWPDCVESVAGDYDFKAESLRIAG